MQTQKQNFSDGFYVDDVNIEAEEVKMAAIDYIASTFSQRENAKKYGLYATGFIAVRNPYHLYHMGCEFLNYKATRLDNRSLFFIEAIGYDSYSEAACFKSTVIAQWCKMRYYKA